MISHLVPRTPPFSFFFPPTTRRARRNFRPCPLAFRRARRALHLFFAASRKRPADNDSLMDETRAGKCSDFTRPDLISLIRAKLGHGVGVNKQNVSGLQ